MPFFYNIINIYLGSVDTTISSLTAFFKKTKIQINLKIKFFSFSSPYLPTNQSCFLYTIKDYVSNLTHFNAKTKKTLPI